MKPEEKFKSAAQEFCEAEGMKVDIRCWYGGKVQTIPDILAKFLQSMIEQGKVVSNKEHESLIKASNVIAEAWEKTLFKPTISSAGKEVKTAEEVIEEYFKDSYIPSTMEYSTDEDVVPLECCIKLMGIYASQFKSSPASTEISDNEVEESAKDFKIWCDNQVIAGRTTHKLFLDWKESKNGIVNN